MLSVYVPADKTTLWETWCADRLPEDLVRVRGVQRLRRETSRNSADLAALAVFNEAPCHNRHFGTECESGVLGPSGKAPKIVSGSAVLPSCLRLAPVRREQTECLRRSLALKRRIGPHQSSKVHVRGWNFGESAIVVRNVDAIADAVSYHETTAIVAPRFLGIARTLRLCGQARRSQRLYLNDR